MADNELVKLAEQRAISKMKIAQAEVLTRMLEHQIPAFAQDRDESLWRRLDSTGDYTFAGLTEMWAAARSLARKPIGRCILQSMQDFIIGRSAEITPVDENEKVRKYWGDWQKDQKFDMKSKEMIRRTLRDGDLFLRWFRPMRGSQFQPVRFVDPREIQPSRNGKPAYGIAIDANDYELVRYYNRVWTPEGSRQERTERILPRDLDHWKILVDSEVKRGVSYYVGMAHYAGEYSRWLADRIELNKIRHYFNVVGKVTGGDLDSFEDELTNEVDISPVGATPKKKQYKPGGVLLQEGVEWDLKSLNINASDTADDGRAIQLQIAIATGLPEYIVRGDASNANYASTMVSESPFVKLMESWQDYFDKVFQAIHSRVISYGMQIGAVPTKTTKIVQGWDREAGKDTETKEDSDTDLTATVNFAVLLHRDLDKETKAYVAQTASSLASQKTAREKLGYDNEEELDQLDKEDREAAERAERWDVPPVPDENNPQNQPPAQKAKGAKDGKAK